MPLRDLIKQVYVSLHKMSKSLLPITVYYHTHKNNTLSVNSYTQLHENTNGAKHMTVKY